MPVCSASPKTPLAAPEGGGIPFDFLGSFCNETRFGPWAGRIAANACDLIRNSTFTHSGSTAGGVGASQAPATAPSGGKWVRGADGVSRYCADS